MDDLVEFLRARLDEDEEAGKAATPGPWRATHRDDGTHHVFAASDRKVHRDGGYPPDWPEDVVNPTADADHIARYDPARVLREVEAKRRILADYERYATERRRAMGGWYDEGASPILAVLAAVYADHPDYRPEWAPSAPDPSA